ncbi:MAG TPA: DUF5916 domain-containing protein [Thermoanaerobaculia bacterium]|nr:DUF5916 domain-containing protein [Thermoanaerobaculia bacterium]
MGKCKRKDLTPWVLLLVAGVAEGANWPERPRLTAVRVSAPPVIDGDLSDAAWQSAPEFTDFTQHDPDDGQPATLPTSVRIVYDDDAIYFGAKMTDTHPPSALLSRRDTFTQTDFLSINLDPQLDRLSGNAFTVTPAGTQLDTVLYNDIGEDSSWDGVWESATRIVADGWVAEVRVPFSQLRFPDRPEHVWGLNITRRTVRRNEWVRIVNTRKGETGFVSHFADITGISGIRRGRSLELVPYAVARSDIRTRADRSNPLLERRDMRADGGLDVKYALTSSLTLTGTINPDFGQVEVDPAVVNLSQFETFYPEKRPFFTEGTDIFRFGDTPAPSHFSFFFTPSQFYTRRVGRAPQLRPDALYVSAPSETAILGAAKLTGKLPGGWSLGLLDALTDTEHAHFVTPGVVSGRQAAEPMTNYFVARATKQIGSGSRVGVLVTSVQRRLPAELSLLRRSATTAGIDAYTSFRDKSWILEGFAVGSRVAGSAEAIEATQSSPSRYYNRPDATHVVFDPARTSLSGWGGSAMISKATGLWRPIVQVHAYSPGYETNDAGFMQRTDIVSGHALMQYVNQNVTKRFRERNVWFGMWQNRNFDGDTLERGFFADAFATLQNYWEGRVALFAGPDAFSDQKTRGGPLVRSPGFTSLQLSVSSDHRRRFAYGARGRFDRYADGSYARTAGVSLQARPSSSLQITLEPSFTRSHDDTQYVDDFADAAAAATFGRRYLFARLDQHSFEIGTRADWTLNARFSIQLYVQPFVSAGNYHDYHTLAAARTRHYTPYSGAVGSDDFNFRSVRGSAVARWEFRPGSALYIAWNENRATVAGVGDFRFGRDLRAIPGAPSHDVFLVKLSYWLPL